MTGQALGAGTPRRRVLFGLLDADSWSWASLKAVFWFIVVILLLGYIPDRAYYFTVFNTIDIGINAISPVNLCPPENKNLPCPAPVGAVVPWDPAPQQLALPAARVDGVAAQVGAKILYIGGSDGQAASDKVYVTDAFAPGTFAPWKDGPALPAPRSKPGVAFLAGSVYVAGGYDAAGAPTTTLYVLTPDASTGDLKAWAAGADAKPSIDLPEARAASSLVAVSDGLLLLGGVGPDGKPTNTVWKATLDSTGKLGAWQPTLPMVDGSGNAAPRADATAVLNGSHVFVYGGRDAAGPSAVVMRGNLGSAGAAPGASPSPSPAAGATPAAPAPQIVVQWAQGVGATNLPAPRTDAAGFTANGGLYLVGGSDGTTAKSELYWAIPDANGNIPEWKHLQNSDLPAGGLSGSSAVVSGANVFVIGGRTTQGLITGAARANRAPQPPFFQLGLIGATIPALKIEGEVGQQLGYLAAAGAGTVNFLLLILIGWALAHKERTRELLSHLRRRGRGSS
jgi:hypothetical protein